MKGEWGAPLKTDDFTTYVRRFGRKSRAWGESRVDEYITGARTSSKLSHEIRANSHRWMRHSFVLQVLLSYSSDAVYLYSTMDDTTDALDLGNCEYPDENFPMYTFRRTMQLHSFFEVAQQPHFGTRRPQCKR